MRQRMLFLKQGFKSIFRYKLQFFIIMILSFITGFYISSIVTMNTRLDKLYDVVEKNTKNFDYEYDKKITQSVNNVVDTTDIYLPINDFITENYLSAVDATNTKKTEANVFFATRDPERKSFITKAFSSNAFKAIFAEQYVQNLNDAFLPYSYNNSSNSWFDLANSDFTYQGLGVLTTKYEIEPNVGNNLYGPKWLSNIDSLNESIQHSNVKSNSSVNSFRSFIAMTTGLLMKYFIDDFENQKNKNTINNDSPLVYKYFNGDNDDFSTLKKDFSYLNDVYTVDDNQIYNDITTAKDSADYKKDNKLLLYPHGSDKGWGYSMLNIYGDWYAKNGPNDKVWNYTYSTFSSLAYQLLNEIVTFHQKAWDVFYEQYTSVNNVTNKPDLEKPEVITAAYNEYYSKNHSDRPQLGIFNGNSKSQISGDERYESEANEYEAMAGKNMITDFEYLFGNQFINNDGIRQFFKDESWYSRINANQNGIDYLETNKALNEKFIISDDNSNQFLSTIAAGAEVDENAVYTGTIDKGLRGESSPLQVSLEGNKVLKVKTDANYNILSRTGRDYSYTTYRGGLNCDYDDIDITKHNNKTETNPSGKNNFTNEKYHQEMAASITNYDVYTREEGYLFDSKINKTFRFILIDNNYKDQQNLNFIDGTYATASNEIMISQQYAIKNKIKLGRKININGVDVVVTGFATDSLSLYPNVDLTSKITDISNQGIIYLSKSTLKNIASNGVGQNIIFNNYYFLTHKGKADTKEADLKVYNALINTNQTSLNVVSDIIKNRSNSSFWAEDKWKNGNDVKDFEDTNFNLNLTIEPMFKKTITMVVIAASAIILMITLFALGATIKKNIASDSSQISYLKAMGTTPKEMATMYLSYSLIITLVVVPLSWIAGSMFQEVLVRLFMSYLTTRMFEFVFSWQVLLILIAAIGIPSILFSFGLTMYYTNKKVLNTKGISYKESKRKKVLKLSFQSRFDWKIATRGKGTIFFVGLTMFFVTTLISTLTYIPTLFERYISDANKFFNYKNSYTSTAPYQNSPLSARGINAWSGPENINKSTIDLSGTDFGSYIPTYYEKNYVVSDSTGETSVIPWFQSSKKVDSDNFKVDDIKSALENTLISKHNSTKENNSFVLFLINSVLRRMGNMNAANLSMGQFQQLIDYVAHSKYSPTSGNEIPEGESGIKLRTDEIEKVSDLMQNGLPTLLKTILANADVVIDFTKDWKTLLLDLINQKTPNNISNYLYSNSRVDQFNIGFNSEDFVPGQDTLSTYADLIDINSDNSFGIDGLKENQLVYNLSDIDQSKIFIDDENVISAIKDVVDGKDVASDIYYKGQKIYDASATNKTIYIPSTLNKSLINKLGMRYSDTSGKLSLKSNVLRYNLVGNYKSSILPKGAWVYDNRDVYTFSKDSTEAAKLNIVSSDKDKWLDPFEMDDSKFIHERQFSESNSKLYLQDGTSWFDQLVKDDEGKTKLMVRPYYNYNNIRIYVPADAVGSWSNLTRGMSSGSREAKNQISDDTDNGLANQTGWWGETTGNKVPEGAVAAWKNIKNGNDDLESSSTKWYFINPYNLSYDSRYDATKEYGQPEIQDLMNNYINFWANESIGSSTDKSLITDYASVLPNDVSLRLLKKSTLETYNSEIVVADQDLINTLLGYSTNKATPVSHDYLDYDSQGYTYKMGNANIDVYDTKTTSKLLSEANEDATKLTYGYNYLSNDESFLTKYGTQSRWFNKKYSNLKEPTGLTTGIKGVINSGIGATSLGNTYEWLAGLKNSYGSVDYFSTRLGIIIDISETILSIAIFAISGIIIITILLICVIGDIFISEYRRFIVVMKSMGYKNREIIRSVMLIQGMFSLILTVLGMAIGSVITKYALGISVSYGLDVPFMFVWWLPLAVIAVIGLSYITGFYVSLNSTLRQKPTTLFKQ